jgi:hypothetical protein
MTIYTERGYRDRHEYLRELALTYSVPVGFVLTLAGLLGPNEDFDGLVTGLEDYSDMYSV